MSYDYDLFVIGAGSGGVRASRIAAQAGARVAICEDKDLGGTCVNLGCVPKKLYVYGSHYRRDFEDAAGYGWEVGPRSFSWQTLLANKDKEIARLNRVYGRLLEDAGAEILRGRGVIVGPHEVEVNGRRHTARYILIATGGAPTLPEVPGADLGVTSDQFFRWDELPRRVLVVGGGYIGVELACILHGLGAEVTQIYRGALFLRGFDDDVRSFLAEEMRKAGIGLHFEQDLRRLERGEGGTVLAVMRDGEERSFDKVLFATGRHPRTEGLGLDSVAVARDKHGAIIVDDHYRTNVPSIYAVGDVIGHLNLTPVALAQGMAVARALFEEPPAAGHRRLDYASIPTAVFSQPPVGTVGLTEAAARARFGAVDIYKSVFTPMKHTMTARHEKTLMKLVVDRASQRVLGFHMVGHDAGEIIQGLAVALTCGVTKQQLDATIGIHPTAAEEFVTMRKPLPDPEPPAVP